MMDPSRHMRLWNLTKTDPQAVVTELQAEASSKPADPHVLYLQGVAYCKLKNWTAAKRLLERAVAANPNNAHAWYYLAGAAEQQHLTPEAVLAYRAAAAFNPSPQLAPLVQKKLATLDPDYQSSQPMRPPPEPPRAGGDNPPLQSQLVYPNTQAGWKQREEDERRLAELRTRAEYRASIVGLPSWAKVITVVVALIILVGGVYTVTDGFGERSRNDQQSCEQLRNAGFNENNLPPWC
jgi:tetratricopeptide (TPR) repeat protein